MSNVSGIGDAYYWSVFKIAEAFGLHRDTVKKRLLAANTPVAATVRGMACQYPHLVLISLLMIRPISLGQQIQRLNVSRRTLSLILRVGVVFMSLIR